MKIRTAWVETEIGYELVAASSDDDYYFEEAVENAALDYGEEPQILCLDVDDDLVAGLFPDRTPDHDDASVASSRDSDLLRMRE